ncbi:ROK family protein [Vagococcus fessus]|uniref:ROK family protein n=1 Tax=Vagococcus fessus TaxID=120370 RepID=A0A430A6E2_9ENTE|nr:ROK family protein [Vagococcus fessus]RSU02474.1 hypothetical protein CBF31_08895 [Vagococcus fessus]
MLNLLSTSLAFLLEEFNITFLKQLCETKEELTIEKILKAYQLGDEGIITILHNAIKYLAITINNLSLMLDTTRIILHGELFKEPQLITLVNDLLNKNSALLSTEIPLNVVVKDYHDVNGAIAACGLGVSKSLLESS